MLGALTELPQGGETRAGRILVFSLVAFTSCLAGCIYRDSHKSHGSEVWEVICGG